MSGGGSVWVVARALDTLYDVFGADECPPHLFSDLQIMPILKTIAAQLPKRVKLMFVCRTLNCMIFLSYNL